MCALNLVNGNGNGRKARAEEPEARVELRGRQVGIITAIPNENVSMHYTYSLASTLLAARDAGLNVALLVAANSAKPARHRNDLLASGLENPDLSAFVFIDPAVGWEVPTFMRVLQHALHPSIGVCGVVPTPVPGNPWAVEFDDPTNIGDFVHGGVFPCKGVSSRFLAMSRAFVQYYKGLPSSFGCANFFESSILDAGGKVADSDFLASRFIRRVGLPVFVDPNGVVGSVGIPGMTMSLMSQIRKTE